VDADEPQPAEPKQPPRRKRDLRMGELVILFVAILAPWFFMAKSIDSDEGRKGAASAAMAAIVGGFAAWKRRSDE
jgi:uncharacterized membrane protein